MTFEKFAQSMTNEFIIRIWQRNYNVYEPRRSELERLVSSTNLNSYLPACSNNFPQADR